MREKLIDVLLKYKNAFATDKKPLAAIIWHEEDIILNVEEPYPPLLRIPACPAVTGALGQKYKSGLALSNQGTHLEDPKE
ncbi:hypothetical protein O181_129162 [Austropuccinia psidii MF-1]|uniref:Uncharacterized protein n=1 Tax=Austropuccinia psidii MF-1 TaxID=1389203 RepID=A0A9Q3QB74_9BASI|nr:hypothetical protein [Austropuccinia psidii MF-1]